MSGLCVQLVQTEFNFPSATLQKPCVAAAAAAAAAVDRQMLPVMHLILFCRRSGWHSSGAAAAIMSGLSKLQTEGMKADTIQTNRGHLLMINSAVAWVTDAPCARYWQLLTHPFAEATVPVDLF